MPTISVNSGDILSIAPVIVLSIFGIYLVLQGIFAPRLHRLTLPYLGLVGIGVAMTANFLLLGKTETTFSGMIRVDSITVVLNFIFLTTAALSLLLTTSYSDQVKIEFIEFAPLMLFATVGMMLMGSAASLMIIFLGLETMSIALYVLAGFRRHNRRSLESALKYFLLGAFATGFLLYGIALTYGAVGTTELQKITEFIAKDPLHPSALLVFGIGLIIVGFGFKVALVPFHMWTPDVYEGAPMPVTAYMAVGAKAAGFAAIIRVLSIAAIQISYDWTQILWILAVLTMTTGNIIALVQDNIKRMLAYSSIAHAGYILMGVVAGNDLSVRAILFYLIAYMFMNLGAFAVASIVSGNEERRVKIEYFSGLGFSRPILGLAMAVCMFSLAGLPPTAGFMGKFYLFSAALKSGYLWLVIFGVINSLISVYYYLRVVVAMYMQDPVDQKAIPQLAPGVGLVILAAILGIFYLGLFPNAMLSLLQ